MKPIVIHRDLKLENILLKGTELSKQVCRVKVGRGRMADRGEREEQGRDGNGMD